MTGNPTAIHVRGGHAVGAAPSETVDVVVEGDSIVSISSARLDIERSGDIDASELLVAPGFVDLQINGGFGLDLLANPDAMWELGCRLPCHGVTSFLPTIISSPASVTDAAMASLCRRPASHVGAEPLGLHFEGPMLNPSQHGAHQVDHLVAPNSTAIEHWSRRSGVAMVTIAPELPGAAAAIALLVERGVTVSAGHTDATSNEADAARRAGMTAVTHLFNAMAPLDHRRPNLVGVALADDHLVVGLIADGVHVDPVAIRAVWNAKGPTGIALVTDAVAAMCQPQGEYQLGGRRITADDTGVRNDDGTLAGSTLTMDRAVRNFVAFTGCSVDEALMSVTTTPADLVGARRRGRIEEGAIADVVLLDQQLEVQVTICAGRVAFVADCANDRVPDHLKEYR